MPTETLTKPVRLNLGGAGEGHGREHAIEGFLTVDLRNNGDTDIVADVSKLDMFEDNSVDCIYSSNVLEHFSLQKTVDVLKEWRRVLRVGGVLYLSVPDFDASIRLYQKHGLAPWVQYLIWGDQLHPLNYHYINFTGKLLAVKLTEAGFSSAKKVDAFPFGVQDASTIKDNVDNEPVSLNIEATK